MRLAWTLLALPALGVATARAERPSEESMADVAIAGSASHRGVAQDYLVAPAGGELTGQMRFLTADGGQLGDAPIRFSDVALFGLAGRWSVFSRLELSGHVELLPKQPAETDEKTWQSVGFGLRSPIASNTVALALDGNGGHLLGHDGSWFRQSIGLEIRKPVHDILTFDVVGGADTTALVRHDHDGGWLTELGVSGSALVHDPHGTVGGWLGLSYAIPVSTRGMDPTTDMPLDPQPRLDFRVGGVLSVAENWDVFAEYLVVDRGDRARAATQLPVLDGGFDQRQIIFGITRHVHGKAPAGDASDGGGDEPVAL